MEHVNLDYLENDADTIIASYQVSWFKSVIFLFCLLLILNLRYLFV